MFSDSPFDAGFFDSQIRIIRSEALALQVVKKLDLGNDPHFLEPGGGLIKSIINFPFRLTRQTPQGPNLDANCRAAGAILGKLDAKRVGVTAFVEVSYQSEDPELASKIVEAVAEAYVQDQANSRNEMIKGANAWLQERLDALRHQAYADEQAVNAYKAKHKIIDVGGKLMDEQALGGLNAAVIEARARSSEARARLDRIQAIIKLNDPAGAMEATVSDAINNPVMTKLRQDYLALDSRYREYSARYGEKHQAVINLREKLKSIKLSIADELRRVAEVSKSEYLIAKKRQEELTEELATSVSQSQETERAQVVLRELESAAQSSRTLYNSFQQRLVESAQQQSYVFSDARVVGPVSVENQKRFPKILALFTVGGLALGGGLGLLREALDRTFRTSKQAEDLLRLSCVALVPLHSGASMQETAPLLSGASSSDRVINNLSMLSTMISKNPYSYFAEAIRTVKLALDLHINLMNGPSEETMNAAAIGITSALPDEGKSTLTACLAAFISLVGRRVLVVDCDLRNPHLSRALTPNAERGLLEVLSGKCSLDEAVWTDAEARVTFLPAVGRLDPADEAEVFVSAGIRKLFGNVRKNYDYILIDLPPIACVADVRASANWIDAYLLVVEWGRTNINVVQRALSAATEIYSKVCGVVLNKTDMAYISKYDTHYLKDVYQKHQN